MLSMTLLMYQIKTALLERTLGKVLRFKAVWTRARLPEEEEEKQPDDEGCAGL